MTDTYLKTLRNVGRGKDHSNFTEMKTEIMWYCEIMW